MMPSAHHLMIKTHNLGFPRIGSRRELKFALESYWRGDSSLDELQSVGEELRIRHWGHQRDLGMVPVGDFSFYDQVLDMSWLLGNLPERCLQGNGLTIDAYFRAARGRSAPMAETCGCGVAAGEMTKWFDTNYHYIVPEFTAGTTFRLHPERLLAQFAEALALGVNAKPVIIGPLTYLGIGKAKDSSHLLAFLPRLIPVYIELLKLLAAAGAEWVQIDEPLLATELSDEWKEAYLSVYSQFRNSGLKLMLATYFGPLLDNLPIAVSLPVDGIHLDVTGGLEDLEPVLKLLPDGMDLSLGVVSGRNVWRTDLVSVLDWLEPVARKLGSRLWIAPSCSLLHVPVDLSLEESLDPEVKPWLAFAIQKIREVRTLGVALNHGRAAAVVELALNQASISARRASARVHDPKIKSLLGCVDDDMTRRRSPYALRRVKQADRFKLPLFPTTTIGSFPQTSEIRQARARHRRGELSEADYLVAMMKEVSRCVREQESLGLDVLVHGEAERNDMVEYFGERLDGFVFSQSGWVQSYGSRCVKPPILFGDVSRPRPMTVEWATYAQSLTAKPIKGMLTGPVTILNWSFVRDDQPRSVSCLQIALAIRQEVLDLERAGVGIIQIDEAALREGLPLRRSVWKSYLDWAVAAFRVSANGISDHTQLHTHMCYSEFNEIISSIAEMDADVLTIETSRSDMELLRVFGHFHYPNEIGPGVYDIHSPNIPTVEQMVQLLRKASESISADRLWVNPDCGLKTRQWSEVTPALTNMVAAAKVLRNDSQARN